MDFLSERQLLLVEPNSSGKISPTHTYISKVPEGPENCLLIDIRQGR